MRTPEAIGRLEAAPARERIGTTHRPRAVLLLACCAHFVHDGFADILYVLLPLWAREFGLAFVQVGAIRTVYSGAMALFQIPAGLLAERWGERRLLALGTAVTGAGFIATGWTGGFASLLLVLLVAGLGSGVQHPLSSTLVSTAYETGRRRAACTTSRATSARSACLPRSGSSLRWSAGARPRPPRESWGSWQQGRSSSRSCTSGRAPEPVPTPCRQPGAGESVTDGPSARWLPSG